jgi:hypothetical protein
MGVTMAEQVCLCPDESGLISAPLIAAAASEIHDRLFRFHVTDRRMLHH